MEQFTLRLTPDTLPAFGTDIAPMLTPSVTLQAKAVLDDSLLVMVMAQDEGGHQMRDAAERMGIEIVTRPGLPPDHAANLDGSIGDFAGMLAGRQVDVRSFITLPVIEQLFPLSGTAISETLKCDETAIIADGTREASGSPASDDAERAKARRQPTRNARNAIKASCQEPESLGFPCC